MSTSEAFCCPRNWKQEIVKDFGSRASIDAHDRIDLHSGVFFRFWHVNGSPVRSSLPLSLLHLTIVLQGWRATGRDLLVPRDNERRRKIGRSGARMSVWRTWRGTRHRALSPLTAITNRPINCIAFSAKIISGGIVVSRFPPFSTFNTSFPGPCTFPACLFGRAFIRILAEYFGRIRQGSAPWRFVRRAQWHTAGE